MRRFFSSFLSAVGKKRGRRRQDKTATSQGVHKRKCGRSSRCVSVYPPIFGLPKDRGISLLFSGRMLFYFFGFSGHTAKKSISRSISSPTFVFAIQTPSPSDDSAPFYAALPPFSVQLLLRNLPSSSFVFPLSLTGDIMFWHFDSGGLLCVTFFIHPKPSPKG